MDVSLFIVDSSQPTHLITNQEGAWPSYSTGGGSSAGALSSGSSSSSTISNSYPPYLGCNSTSSPSATYNPPALTYTDLGVGGSGNSASSNNIIGTSITHGQVAPVSASGTVFSDCVVYQQNQFLTWLLYLFRYCMLNGIQFKITIGNFCCYIQVI